ncbi:hypothetical protein ACFQFC_41015 [Amorphoplanes digitatis]|uniref:Multidrug efflux pump subunit AcrA (Membrane-fusion protein) n=1 Tax=Actinoplanes digitatis TaxID=1868 RepID=A0A7W7HXI1_9ACTN|nr:hypothetical protein [Actinoplanes digitatis]MBB4762556.1 multidrug efflux pump subunit AcrA (membrane-fusion protein) [Actinoplanes digitatis]GID92316.1 hypothetical protein Adi01nite_17280 [Actinoplanes digitatis]
MDAPLVAALSSVGVAALTVGVNALTTITSLKTQRENTRATLDSQLALVHQQEQALRERSHGQELRERRAPIYGAIVEWTYALLAALADMTPERPQLERDRWHIERAVEEEIDLYVSDLVHIRFTALRALLIGVTQGSTSADSPLLSWTERDGTIIDTREGRTERLDDWPARDRLRQLATSRAIGLVAAIRAEMQGVGSSGYFYTYRLDRE